MNDFLVPQDANDPVLGLSASVRARCVALTLSTEQIKSLAWVAQMFEEAPASIVKYMEKGLSLDRISDCLRLREDRESLGNTSVWQINAYIDRIGFNNAAEDENFGDIGENRILEGGLAYSPEDYERKLLADIVNGGALPGQLLAEHGHDIVLEVLTEAGSIRNVMRWIDIEHDGQILEGYNAIIDNEVRAKRQIALCSRQQRL